MSHSLGWFSRELHTWLRLDSQPYFVKYQVTIQLGPAMWNQCVECYEKRGGDSDMTLLVRLMLNLDRQVCGHRHKCHPL